MVKYFVLFKTEKGEEINDIYNVPKKLKTIEDIRDLEKKIANEWFGDEQKVTLLNYKKM